MNETQILVGHRAVEGKRQHLGFVQDDQTIRNQLDGPCPELGVFRAFKPPRHGAGHLDDILVAQRMGGFGHPGMFFRAKNHLGHALAVAQIDENDPAVVAPGANPSRQGHAPADVLGAQRAAGVASKTHGAGV